MDQTSMKSVRIVDNFYQSSSFFPMPTLLVGTLCEDGSTSFGAYSLCFPFYIAGKGYYAMMLNCRNSSNTCKNIMERGKATLNFIPDDKKILREAVLLGFPGDKPEEKMKNFKFTMKDGLMAAEHPEMLFPKVIEESFQVFECSWMKEIDGAENDVVCDEYKPPFHTCNGITSPHGAHFILRVDKILLKERYRRAILDGVTARLFPRIPVDYGYRDNKNFWISRGKAPYRATVQFKEVNIDSVMYAANRIDPEVRFTREACAMMTKVPRVFLNTALKGCVNWAKEHGVALILPEHIEKIRSKRTS